MKTILKIVSIILIFLNVNLQAESVHECKSDLYFANGIMMKYSDQNASLMWLDEVDDLLVSKPEVYKNIANIRVAYNQSQGFLDDLIESFEQVMSNEWDWKTFTAFFTTYLIDKGIQEDWIPHIKDLTKQVNSYKESIKLGHGVVVIAHSQGNYYTNEAYDLLDEWMKPYFKMMGVATPANHVAGFSAGDTTSPYVTFHNDFINMVVTGLPSNRDDTRHHGFPSVDAHDFYESYLKETTTRIEIQSFIINQIIGHEKAPSQWETDQELERNTCDYKITVKHRYDQSIEMGEKVYPFNASKKLYQVNGEWVKASCGGENILGLDHDIPTWDGKKDSECLMIDNVEEEKIYEVKKTETYRIIIGGSMGSYLNVSSWYVHVSYGAHFGNGFVISEERYGNQSPFDDHIEACNNYTPEFFSNYSFLQSAINEEISFFKEMLIMEPSIVTIKEHNTNIDLYHGEICSLGGTVTSSYYDSYKFEAVIEIEDIQLFKNSEVYKKYSPKLLKI